MSGPAKAITKVVQSVPKLFQPPAPVKKQATVKKQTSVGRSNASGASKSKNVPLIAKLKSFMKSKAIKKPVRYGRGR